MVQRHLATDFPDFSGVGMVEQQELRSDSLRLFRKLFPPGKQLSQRLVNTRQFGRD